MNWLKRLASTETFRVRARAVELLGFGMLSIGLYWVWAPLFWLTIGCGVVAYAQLMRR